MYDERRESFSIKEVILQILFVVLFVFILIWLFPTKGYLDKKLDEIRKNSGAANIDNIKNELAPLYSQIFTSNITNMKSAAKGYFTVERLPKTVGDKVKKTLKEMQELNLILPFKDSNNNDCDLEKSYVEVTKMESEYQMKVNLSCTDNDAYIVEYMGCYAYCTTTICENNNNNNGSSTPTSNKKYKYEYSKVINATMGNWSNWSAWSTNKVTKTDYKDVETKEEKVLSHYNQVWGIIKTETKTETKTEEANYITSTTNTQQTRSVTSTKVFSHYTWSSKVRQEFTTDKKDTETKDYTYVSSRVVSSCTTTKCTKTTYYTFDVQTRTTNYKTEYSCPDSSWTRSGSTCYKSVPTTTKTCPAGYTDTGTKCTKTSQVTVSNPIYGWTNGDPVYTTVTYYRYRERTTTGGTTDYKWSTSQTDQDLIKAGYSLTGKKEEITV